MQVLNLPQEFAYSGRNKNYEIIFLLHCFHRYEEDGKVPSFDIESIYHPWEEEKL